ncbi:MAG: hypothetical protein MJ219_03755 [Mycoplasmoidaceae bacterium]|nr:hypothetical protein [Mycoplasmoidaceae bacterium]
MTDIQVYGGVTCDTSGAKFDADGGINLTYELKEGRVRTEDDITLSVQGKDIESGELT